MKIRGPTSFDDLKTTYDPSRNPPHVIHQTFQDACLDLGLLQDDQEWIKLYAKLCNICFRLPNAALICQPSSLQLN